MTDKEKRELKDNIINIFKRFNILGNTASIGELRDDILKCVNFIQEEPVSEELVKAAITAADEDMQGRQIMEESNENRQLYSRIFRRGFKAGAKWQKEKDSIISEDLEEAADDALNSVLNTHEIVNIRSCLEMFRLGAKWQKEKDKSTTEDLGEYINELSKQFPEVSFAKLSRIAVRVANWQKEQMMAKAIDAELYSDGMFIPLIGFKDREKVSDIKFGDKVKVIIIKED